MFVLLNVVALPFATVFLRYRRRVRAIRLLQGVLASELALAILRGAFFARDVGSTAFVTTPFPAPVLRHASERAA